MTKPKTLEQLRAEKERAETQLAQEKHKLINLLPVACEMPIWIALFTAVSIFALFFLAYKHFSKHQVMN